MREELIRIESSAKSEIPAAETQERLDSLRVQFLGRERGALTVILRSLKELPEAERRLVGAEANRLREAVERWLSAREAELRAHRSAEVLQKERLDITRPSGIRERGHLHPITQAIRRVERIFVRMGFTVAEGPEIETEYYNFDALNIPKDHPARDMWDTFWLKDKTPKGERLLLRTHTSPVQIRYMETHEPPIRIIVPGRAYRYEATDASHDFEFWQIEGLMVDREMTAGNFKAVIERFLSEFFEKEIKTRFRPSYFPFVEPAFEVDMTCANCGGKGCSLCSDTGWLEMMGAGMVHPHVFKNAGYNPNEVRGFAFGMGLDRLVLMRHKIPDIRLLRSGDLRFLKQF